MVVFRLKVRGSASVTIIRNLVSLSKLLPACRKQFGFSDRNIDISETVKSALSLEKQQKWIRPALSGTNCTGFGISSGRREQG